MSKISVIIGFWAWNNRLVVIIFSLYYTVPNQNI